MKPTPGSSRAAHRALAVERLEDRTLFSSGGLTAFDQLTVDPTRYDANHVLVAFRETAPVPAAVVRPDSAVDLGYGLFRFELAAGVTVETATAFFQMQSNVRYAQPDYTVSVGRTPNDPGFVSQWGLHNTGQNGGTADADVDAPEAWNVRTGSGGTVVAVIDTGVDYTHPDLAANVWTNVREISGNGVDDDGNGYVDDVRGWDFANNDNNPMDDNGHGTHVAGIIGAVGDNNIGVTGVNWRVQIMPVKFLGANGTGLLSDAVRGLNYAVANGAAVSNHSYSGGGYYQAFFDALESARQRGHIVVAAAGNSGTNTDANPAYPAGYGRDNVMSVAAVDRTNALASFSNFGATSVDLGAPGVSVYSTYRSGGYASLSGTSMAAPFVAGAAALLRDTHPDWTYRQIINQILNTTDPLPSLSGKTATGGRLNLNRALGGSAGDAGGPAVTAAVFSGALSGRFDRVRVTFSEAINATTFTAADVVSFDPEFSVCTGINFTVTPVSGTHNQFDVTFPAQTQTGTYALTIGPDVRDLAGNPMNQNGNGVNGETADRYTATATLSGSQTFSAPGGAKAIPDRGKLTSTLSVNQDVTIGKLSVKLNITHPNDGDLNVTVTAPWGATVVLVNRRGGSGDNFNTVFDDRSTTPVRNAAAPFAGWHRPEEALSAFAGRNARGTWTLTVEDMAGGNVGRLNSWSITVESGGGAAGAQSAAAVVPVVWVGEAGTKMEWVGARAPRGPVARPVAPTMFEEWLGRK